jgi:hypothetical protein
MRTQFDAVGVEAENVVRYANAVRRRRCRIRVAGVSSKTTPGFAVPPADPGGVAEEDERTWRR